MPVWLDEEAVDLLHEIALYEDDISGQNPGSDLGGAVSRPVNQYHYGGVNSLPELAAHYGVAIAKAHAFRDGNKRTALLAVDAFLDQNDVRFYIDDAKGEAEPIFKGVASGEIDHKELAAWIETHIVRPGFDSSFSSYWGSMRALFPTDRPRAIIRKLKVAIQERLGS
jgi:death-on-curing protein